MRRYVQICCKQLNPSGGGPSQRAAGPNPHISARTQQLFSPKPHNYPSNPTTFLVKTSHLSVIPQYPSIPQLTFRALRCGGSPCLCRLGSCSKVDKCSKAQPTIYPAKSQTLGLSAVLVFSVTSAVTEAQ
jgi:hypothetical protein